MSGLKLCLSYALPPFRFGFCGPEDKKSVDLVERYLAGGRPAGGVNEQVIRRILANFQGLYPYCKIIAQSNGIKDPLAEEVIEAYWIGNQLLEKAITSEMVPHHSWHVLIRGSVTGRVELKDKLLDFCRVSWGRVKKIKGEKLEVEYQPLIGKKNLQLGKPIKKEIKWDKLILPKVKVDDIISFHWNIACQALASKQVKNLAKYTKLSLDIKNG